MLILRHVTTNADSDWIGVPRGFLRSRSSNQLRDSLLLVLYASHQSMRVLSMRVIFDLFQRQFFAPSE